MTVPTRIFTGGSIFDGATLHHDRAARFVDDVFAGIIDAKLCDPDAEIIDLNGDIFAPGFVDLQVNGGGGVMLNDDPSPDILMTIASAHRTLGTTRLLPTLISDTADKTKAAIHAVQQVISKGVDEIAGLHLEGPHLSIARKGAHDPSLIRPMTDDDLDGLLTAANRLPFLKMTIAPESVTADQVARMSKAGILVSLGHTDADYETCLSYAQAGARCVTHVFNAMSQLGNRQPGLVGAALDCGGLSAGLIADGIHVHCATMRAAWAAKAAPGKLFLVTDAMAVAGTDLTQFALNRRAIHRDNGRLTLGDGTLAGADLDMITAIRLLFQDVGVALSDALSAAISIPAELGNQNSHHLRGPGLPLSACIRISKTLKSAVPVTEETRA